MLRESSRPVGPISQTVQERSGKVLGLNLNGFYSIQIGDVSYENVPSQSGSFYRPGEFVRVEFRDGEPVIVP